MREGVKRRAMDCPEKGLGNRSVSRTVWQGASPVWGWRQPPEPRNANSAIHMRVLGEKRNGVGNPKPHEKPKREERRGLMEEKGQRRCF